MKLPWPACVLAASCAGACDLEPVHASCGHDRGERNCVLTAPEDRDAADGRKDDAGAVEVWPESTHAILEGELLNARDLGGVAIGSDARVAYGVLFRGPPLVLSELGCVRFAELGVRTVIDLRTQEEREVAPESPCVLEGAELIDADLPIPYAVSPTDYIADLDTTGSIAKAFAALADPDAYPIYFHCTWGRDRTGVLAAVILRALGADQGEIMREYLLSKIEVGAYPDSLRAVLEEIERRGGIKAYLGSFGVGTKELATLREQALERDADAGGK